MKRGESGINCLFAIDKPIGPTSHDVVGKVRRALGERRVGHAGTLDPAASGVLVVGVGQGTRLLGMLTLDEKAYVARIKFGFETTTDDAEGDVSATRPVPPELFDEEYAREQVAGLVGAFDQVPPSFSAISVEGRRAYDRARSGEDVALEARPVRVLDAKLLKVELEEDAYTVWTVFLHVSKGTYVRSIARDLGRSLSSAAHLCGLRRVASGSVSDSACLALDEIESLGRSVVPSRCLDPIVALGHPFRVLGARERDDVSCGRKLDAGLCVDQTGTIREPEQGEVVSLVADGCLVGVWSRAGASLRCEANFPAGIVGVGGLS